MDIKDLRGLIEAYQQVNAPEQLDELSVNKMLAYGKAAKKDRDVLNKKWDEKQASHKEKMRVLGHEEGEERAAEKIKKKTGKYPHQMNKLDKARYAVTKEELDIFDVVLEFLYVEGYAETLEEAEWMMANLIDEEAVEIILGEEQLDEISAQLALTASQKADEERRKAAVAGDRTRAAAKAGQASRLYSGVGPRRARERTRTEEFGAWLDAILEGSYEDRIAANNKKYDANRKRAAQRAAARNAARDAGQTGAVPGVGYVTPRRERETYTDSAGKTRHAKGL